MEQIPTLSPYSGGQRVGIVLCHLYGTTAPNFPGRIIFSQICLKWNKRKADSLNAQFMNEKRQQTGKMPAETDRNAEYLFWSHVPYRVDVTDFSYIHLFFVLEESDAL